MHNSPGIAEVIKAGMTEIKVDVRHLDCRVVKRGSSSLPTGTNIV